MPETRFFDPVEVARSYVWERSLPEGVYEGATVGLEVDKAGCGAIVLVCLSVVVVVR